jgi:DNA-binding winged helix-turn-helix (wHTH) protein/class 3 adenylate cyclase/tetratricopeptide (TPR) repeat protein
MRYVFGDYELDTQAHELHRAGAPVTLAPKVYAVLAYLIQHHRRLVPKEELLKQVWPGVYVDDSAVKRCIMAARRVLGERPEASQHIKTVRGQGYRFMAAVTAYSHSSEVLAEVAAARPSEGPPAQSLETAPLATPPRREAEPSGPNAQATSGGTDTQPCPICQHGNSPTARFCVACGASLRLICAHCDQPVLLPATFCPACGQQLGLPLLLAPLPSVSAALHPAMPPSPVGGTPSGERKLITVLCCVVADTPVLVETFGLDTMHRLMQIVYELTLTAGQQYGGTLQPVTGEDFFVLFGAPLAQEDHARRAVLAALGLQRRLRESRDLLRLPSGEDLAIRMALHSGQVVVGQLGNDRTAVVVGDITTLAAALARRATPGTLLASRATCRLVQGEVHTVPLPPLHTDESSPPVAVYQVREFRPQHQRPAATAARPRGPFVGRAAELAVLYARLERAEKDQGQVVGIIGDPGMGKSRLLAEFRQGMQGRAVTYLQGNCRSYGSAIPYLPLLDLLRTAWGIAETDSAEAITAKVRVGLQAAALEPEVWALYLLHLLGGVVEPEWLAGMRPEMLREQTFEALHQFHLYRSRQQPCILEIENLQWIDATSEAYLTALVERLAGAPLLLLVTFRPGYRPPWLDKSYATQMALQPLEPDDSRQVVRAILRHTSLPAALEQQLLAKAEGNPFFLEELAHAVREQGSQQPVLAVPETIQAVIAARLDRLPPAEKQLLQTAAVIGMEVPFPLLRTITGQSDAALRYHLTRLQAAEFLYETRLVPERTYAFKHVLTHEVVYGSLLQEQRRMLHTRVVEALETLWADRLADRLDQLAQHALRGELWDRAYRYFWQAGTHAVARSAYREAVTCFEQALEVLRHLPAERQSREQAIDLRFTLRGALLQLGEVGRALTYMREAEALAKNLDDPHRLGRVSSYMARYFFLMGDHELALAAGQRACALAATLGDFALEVAGNMYLGQVYHALGDYQQALDVLRRNVAALTGPLLQEHFGMANLPAVTSRTYLVFSLAELGQFAEGMARGAEGLSIAEAADHPNSLAIACLGMGRLFLSKGEPGQAIAALERGLSLCRSAQIELLLPAVTAALSYAYALAGRAAEALPLLAQVRQTFPPLTPLSSLAVVWLSAALLHVGNLKDARSLARQALELSQNRQERGNQAWTLQLLGDIAARDAFAEGAQAEVDYQQALALANELGMRPLLAHCHLGLGALYHHLGREGQAQAALLTAMALFRSMDMPFWLPHAETILAQLAKMTR